MAGQTIYITEKEWIAIQDAAEQINELIEGGAEDFVFFNNMKTRLENLFEKYKKARDKDVKQKKI